MFLLFQAQLSPEDPWSVTLTVGEQDEQDDWFVDWVKIRTAEASELNEY